MKTTVVAAVIFGLAYSLQARVPTIELTQAAQDDASRRVTLSYTLDAPGIVTVDVLTNGVSIGEENITHLTGDANKIVEEGARTIYWQPEKSWEGYCFTEPVVSFKLTAWPTNAPPDYMALNMNTWKVRYYTSTNALPGGINDIAWKTEYLLMRRIPAGGRTFIEGSPVTESYRNQYREIPRFVSFSEDFYIGVFEFTYKQFANLKWKYTWKDHGSFDYTGRSENSAICPINAISRGNLRGVGEAIKWPDVEAVDADSVLGYLSAKSNIDFDIPTNAQWEFACRAGAKGALYNNDSLNWDKAAEIGWFHYPENKRVTAPQEVGQKMPNGYGLYDMMGNVKEVTLGYWYDVDHPKSSADVIDPKEGVPSGGGYWSCRGSSYNESAEAAQLARIAAIDAVYGNEGKAHGFRVVCPVGLRK